MGKRADDILDAGLAAVDGKKHLSGAELLKAMAAMIDHATKRARKKPAPDAVVTPFTARDVYEAVRDNCSHAVVCVPYKPNWFPVLQRQLNAAADQLHADDIDLLIRYLNSPEFPKSNYWAREVSSGLSIGFGAIISNIIELFGKARVLAPAGRAGGLQAAMESDV